jgi:hypothetical protein
MAQQRLYPITHMSGRLPPNPPSVELALSTLLSHSTFATGTTLPAPKRKMTMSPSLGLPLQHPLPLCLRLLLGQGAGDPARSCPAARSPDTYASRKQPTGLTSPTPRLDISRRQPDDGPAIFPATGGAQAAC